MERGRREEPLENQAQVERWSRLARDRARIWEIDTDQEKNGNVTVNQIEAETI
jgi:hypothetical protein